MDPDKLKDDQLAEELAKVHDEIANRDAIIGQSNLSQSESKKAFGGDRDDELPGELGKRVDSARKVIELLHRVRPTVSEITDTAKLDSSTPRVMQDNGPFNLKNRPNEDVPTTDIPAVIGRFEIRSLLGKGGFGLVFRGFDPDLNREVALKVPTFDSLIQSDSLQRFRQEGRVVAALSHPNIVPVFEVGNDGPISYIASEYIAGKDLAKWVTEHGPLLSRDAAAVVARLADALQHAHDRDVVHRDLKPANILMEETVQSGNTKPTLDPSFLRITDFGLAKMVGDQENSMTRTGSQLGTPAYSAPEQLLIETDHPRQPLNEKADIYSLGATLYFLLTGSPPFVADNLLQLLKLVETQTPKLPDTVPVELAAICNKALEKSPAQRYATAYDFGRDLLNFVEGRPVTARPASWSEKAIKTVQRNPVVATLTAVTLFSILFGSAASIWSARQARLAAHDAHQQYLESKQVIDDYYVRVSRDPIFMSSAFEREKLRLLDSAKQYYTEFLKENADDEDLFVDLIRTRIYIAYAELGGDNHDQAQNEFKESLRQLDSLASDKAFESSEVEHLRALCLAGLGKMADKVGDYELAGEQLNEAVAIYEFLLPDKTDDRSFIFDLTQAYRNLSHHHRGKGKQGKADEFAIKQQLLLESIPFVRESDPVLENYYAMVLGDRSLTYRDQGDNETSLELLNQSIEISERLIENEPNPVWFAETAAASYYRRGVLQVRSGNLDAALDDGKRSLKLFESLSIHNRNAAFRDQKMSARNLLSVCLEQSGDSRGALELSWENLADAKALVEQQPGRVEFQISLITQLFQLASALTDQGNLNQAAKLCEELDSDLNKMKLAGIRHPMVASIQIANLIEQGRLLHRRKKYDDAIKRLNEALHQVQKELDSGPQQPDLVQLMQSVYDNRSYSHSRLGNFEKAIDDRRESMKLDRNSPGYQSLALAELLANSGDVAQTREILADLDLDATRNELPAVKLEMKLAVIHGAIASVLKRQLESTGDDSGSAEPVNDELNMAESHFLKAVNLGYFENRPKRYASLAERSELNLLFDLPSVREIIDRQKLIWENSQAE